MTTLTTTQSPVQLLQAIEAALAARDMESVIGLLHRLAVVDAGAAGVILAAFGRGAK